MMRTMLSIRLSGYGRETKRPAIGYGQRPENSQRAVKPRIYKDWSVAL